jgi:hypothetical protein
MPPSPFQPFFSTVKITLSSLQFLQQNFWSGIILMSKNLLNITPIFGEVVSKLDLSQFKMKSSENFYLSLLVIKSPSNLLLIL